MTIEFTKEEATQLLAFIKSGTYPGITAGDVTNVVAFLTTKIKETEAAPVEVPENAEQAE